MVESLLSRSFLIWSPHSLTIRKKLVVAVFQSGWSLPNFEGAGHSYFSLIGMEYACQAGHSGFKPCNKSGQRRTANMVSTVPSAYIAASSLKRRKRSTNKGIVFFDSAM